MPIRKIAILLHERHRDALLTAYRIWGLAAHWRKRGITVEPILGIEREIDADLLIPHLDLSYIPDDYWAFLQRHPNVVNRRVRDIRKIAISTNLVQLTDSWQGPVIVKTNLNYRGVMDAQLLGPTRTFAKRIANRITDRLARPSFIERRFLGWRSTPHRYHIFRSKHDVPRPVWTNDALVVERFLPERRGRQYVMRIWAFFGDRGQSKVFYGDDPWIKGQNSEMHVLADPPPPAIVEARHRLGLDYAKMDYVLHDGEAVLIDVNVTQGLRLPTEPSMLERSRHMADGLAYFERSRIADRGSQKTPPSPRDEEHLRTCDPRSTVRDLRVVSSPALQNQEPKFMSRLVKCGLIQTSLAADVSESIETIRDAQTERTLKYIEQAGQEGVQILCLQEIFNGPYFCAEQNPRWYDAAEKIPDGPTTKLMQEYAKKYKMVIVVPLYEEEETGRLLQHRRGHRRRRHVPRQVPQEPHPAHRTRLLGEVLLPPRQPRLSGLRDARTRRSASTSATTATSPRARARSGSNGAEIVFNPSATVAGLSRVSLEARAAGARRRQRLLRRRDQPRRHRSALEHRRVLRPELLLDPRGKILAIGERDKDELVVAELDLDKIREVRNTWQFYRDRRPETYTGIVKL